MRSELFRLLAIGGWVCSYYTVGFELTIVILLAIHVVHSD